MSVTTAHVLYAVNVDSTCATPVLFDQVQDFTCDPGTAVRVLSGDGGVYATYAYTSRIAPTLGFTTTDLPAALGKAALTGFALGSGHTADAYLQLCAEGGTRAGASSHYKLTVNQGILVPTTLAADQDQAALSYTMHATYDCTNEPIALCASETLATGATTAVHFVAGPVVVNGTTINGVQSISVDFGIQVRTLWGDGAHRPTYCYIAAIRPVIRVATLDVSVLNTFGFAGTAQSTTDSLVYFTKCAEGSTRVANATAEHVKLTIDEGEISCEPITGADGAELGAVLVITPTYDGTYAPIVISTVSAIA